MDWNKDKYLALLEKYNQNTASPEEKAYVEACYQYFEVQSNYTDQLDEEAADQLGQSIFNRIERERKPSFAKLILHRSKDAVRYISAAIILIVAAAAILLYTYQSSSTKDNASEAPILPGKSIASLVLPDGSSYLLSDAQKQEDLISKGILHISNKEGFLEYDPLAKVAPAAIKIHEIRTPNGGQYKVILPDGSKVWLNAASSLKFPNEFNESTREVELIGEAYFEVTGTQKNGKNKNWPFLVKSQKHSTSVLGTKFNISAYPEDNFDQVTLLEGKVKIHASNAVGTAADYTLKPNQQATINDKVSVRDVAYATDANAWQQGNFSFSNKDLVQVMRTISRWYDVEVDYHNLPDKKLNGAISRSVSINDILRMVEKTCSIQFKIEGRKVYVVK
ncbi:FecR family protein [Pedobacter nyackensis]|uniref:FecR family protein n=1 Tax=Pedobacter nyackensis TaxID=475255 RepID=A0A1W2B6Q2_9SPHI|nr:FecR family protein [Pedobacter nyackensis]SMC68362.1 FecR family protein [Pedobacter nyackensis]